MNRKIKETVDILISKITISETREIESIELNINDNLIMYLSNGGEPSPDGGGSPFFVISKRMLMINPVNIRSEGKSSTVNSVEYKVKNNTSKIEIISAKSSPTSFNVTFAVDVEYIDEKRFSPKNMKLIDENGKEYQSSGYSKESKDNKTIIATSFPLSSYDNVDKLKLI